MGEAGRKHDLVRLQNELEELRLKQLTQQNILEKDQEQLKDFEERNKILSFGHPDKYYLGDHGKWEPNPAQRKIFKAWSEKIYETVVMTGGNQQGKTFSLVCCLLCTVFGHWPWEDSKDVGHWFWDQHGWKPPLTLRVIGADWESTIKGALVPKIWELWPKSRGVEVRKNQLGVDSLWTDKETGTQFILMSNKQDRKSFESVTSHALFWDEPPDRENYIAALRGLQKNCGKSFMSMTLLENSWIHRDIITATDKHGYPDPSVFVSDSMTYVNDGYGLTTQGIENFEKRLSEEERDARIRGIPTYLKNKIFNIDREKNIIDRFDIPIDWPVDVGIDFGVAKQHDILFLATSPMGKKYAIFEMEIIGSGTEIAASIMKKQKEYNWRINRILCDPLAKASQITENSINSYISSILAVVMHRSFSSKQAKICFFFDLSNS